MSDLTTPAFVQSRLPSLTAAQVAALPGLISTASRLIERYCRRRFTLMAHEEVHTPSTGGEVSLRAYPVRSIDRIYGDWVPGLSVENGSAAVTRATVGLGITAESIEDFPTPTADSLTLSWWSGGAETKASFPFADHPTVADLAVAISGLGSGWSAVAMAGYGEWASVDLWMCSPQSAKYPRAAYVQIPSQEFSAGGFDPGSGILTGLRCCRQLRVRYSAGYDPIPEDLQEACALAVAAILAAPEAVIVQGAGINRRKLGDREIEFANAGVGLSTGVRPSWLVPQVAMILANYRQIHTTAV